MTIELNMSQLSLHSNSSQSEDWDRSLVMNDSEPPTPAESSDDSQSQRMATTTPRNSVVFPATDGEHATPKGPGSKKGAGSDGKRSLSELLKLHAEKGTDCAFSSEEAARIADVLGQWVSVTFVFFIYSNLCLGLFHLAVSPGFNLCQQINASSSPYEGEDDFFSGSQDDLSLPSRRPPNLDIRQRGQSESANSRPPSSASVRS